MERLLLKNLKTWQTSNSRLPLLLRGARQVGKTTLIEQFSEFFTNFININFEIDPQFKECFFDLNPENIISQIAAICQQDIIPGQTLVFLDEIQECPRAIQALRYFKERIPKLHIIGAGSLLEFALNQAEYRMPVGRIEFLYLYPMNFIEFLTACGEKKLIDYIKIASLDSPLPPAIHQRCLTLIKHYSIIGGMPAIVKNYIGNESFLRLQTLQLQLLTTYRNDFGKYASKAYQGHCQAIFNKMPSILSRHFKYVDIDPTIDSRALKTALTLLQQAGLIYPVYETSMINLPLNNHINAKKFKLLFLDLGLIKAAGKIDINVLLNNDLLNVRQGDLAEQLVGQELISYQLPVDAPELFYWARDKKGSQAEIDYVINRQEQIIPIEVKAGTTGRLKSMHMCMQRYSLPLGIKISSAPLAFDKNILSLPFYLVNQLPRLLLSFYKN